MKEIIPTGYVINALVFSGLGLLILWGSFFLFDKLTPYKLWDEIIKGKNTALALVVAAMTLAMGLIVASAIHG